MLFVLKPLLAFLEARVPSFQFEIVRLFFFLLFQSQLFGVLPFDPFDALGGRFAAKKFLAGKLLCLPLRALFLHLRNMLLALRFHLKPSFLVLCFSRGFQFRLLRLVRGLHFGLLRLAFFLGESSVHPFFCGRLFLLFLRFGGAFFLAGLLFRFLSRPGFGFLRRSRRFGGAFPGAFRLYLGTLGDVFHFFRTRRGVLRDVVFFLFHAFNSFLMIRLR